MSSSPAESDWLDETLPLPKAGLIWPWILTGSVMFCLGVYLLLPSLQTHNGPLNVTPAVPVYRETPTAPTTSSRQGVLNFLFVDSASSSFSLAAQKLDGLMREKTRGRLGLTLHPSGFYQTKKLDELSIIECVRSGQAEMALVTCSPLTNFSDSFEVLDLPFLFHSYEQADRVLQGPIGEKMLKSLEGKGLVGLGTLEVGFRIFSSSVPLPTLSDFKGKRVRVMQSATSIQMARQLGCEAVPSPVDKIYQMGKEGYIDAADRTYPTYWDFKLYEVQRYITESRHSYTAKVLIVNKETFEKLSPEDRKSILDSVRQVEGEQRAHQRQDDQQVKQECRKRGIEIYELSAEERQRFEDACKPLYDEYVKLRGKDALEAIRQADNP